LIDIVKLSLPRIRDHHCTLLRTKLTGSPTTGR